jgi:hypothetical protein
MQMESITRSWGFSNQYDGNHEFLRTKQEQDILFRKRSTDEAEGIYSTRNCTTRTPYNMKTQPLHFFSDLQEPMVYTSIIFSEKMTNLQHCLPWNWLIKDN